MKKILYLSIVLVLILTVDRSINAQEHEQNIRTKSTKTTTTTTTVTNSNLKESEAFTLVNGQIDTHNFGNNIKVGNPVEHTFKFRNNGNKAIQIVDIYSSCGCTTPEWSNHAVAPGQTGNIKVRYNSVAVGKFHKSITLNFKDKSTKVLWISGEVIK